MGVAPLTVAAAVTTASLSTTKVSTATSRTREDLTTRVVSTARVSTRTRASTTRTTTARASAETTQGGRGATPPAGATTAETCRHRRGIQTTPGPTRLAATRDDEECE